MTISGSCSQKPWQPVTRNLTLSSNFCFLSSFLNASTTFEEPHACPHVPEDIMTVTGFCSLLAFNLSCKAMTSCADFNLGIFLSFALLADL